jgi:hypothetical protein
MASDEDRAVLSGERDWKPHITVARTVKPVSRDERVAYETIELPPMRPIQLGPIDVISSVPRDGHHDYVSRLARLATR